MFDVMKHGHHSEVLGACKTREEALMIVGFEIGRLQQNEVIVVRGYKEPYAVHGMISKMGLMMSTEL